MGGCLVGFVCDAAVYLFCGCVVYCWWFYVVVGFVILWLLLCVLCLVTTVYCVGLFDLGVSLVSLAPGFWLLCVIWLPLGVGFVNCFCLCCVTC